MINKMISQVAEFHNAFGVERGNVDVELRYKLFKEEFEEYKDAKDLVEKTDAICDMLYIACGTLDVHEWGYEREYLEDNYHKEDTALQHIELSLDCYLIHKKEGWIWDVLECCLDLARLNGIYDILSELFDEVHASNMSKLDENGKPIINDGLIDPTKPKNKILKGKNFFEPKLKEILIKHGKLNA